MSMSRLTEAERFWEKVNLLTPTRCLEWKYKIRRDGYAQFKMRSGKHILAHRKAWELHNGDIPDGALILHTCDNRKCVNPEHLFIGSQKDNVDDMCRKGRHGKTGAVGEGNGWAKLTRDDVIAIRASTDPVADQARMYRVHAETIRRVRKWEIWRSVA